MSIFQKLFGYTNAKVTEENLYFSIINKNMLTDIASW